jgi:hypothetical protein
MKNDAKLPITDRIIALLDGMTLETAIEELFRNQIVSRPKPAESGSHHH